MKKLFFLISALALFSCNNESEDSTNEDSNDITNDTTAVDSVITDEVVSGVQYFEDYAQFDTRTKLYDEFGEEYLDDDTTWYAEGTVMVLISTLDDPTNGNRIRFGWDEENPEELSFIETWNYKDYESNKAQRVDAKNGLYTGMPLEEIVAWNDGKHVKFSGFGWDYSGGVFPGQGESNIASSKIQFSLDMEQEGYETHTHLLGDQIFMSSDEAVKGAPIVLGTMVYYP